MSGPHIALATARRARLINDPMAATPSYLWQLARGDRELFNHAMTEAGHYVSKKTGKAPETCPICGWQAVRLDD